MRTPDDRCPYCDYSLDAVTAVMASLDPSIGPKKGDFSICFKCVSMLTFNEDLSVRKPTLAELDEVGQCQTTLMALGTMRLFHQKEDLCGNDT